MLLSLAQVKFPLEVQSRADFSEMEVRIKDKSIYQWPQASVQSSDSLLAFIEPFFCPQNIENHLNGAAQSQLQQLTSQL